MIYGSVCSGIEAASVAWHPLGWTPSFFSEIEAFPRAVLAHHYPEVPLHGDFTTIEAGQYQPIDLLVGGTPCQSFSVAGRRLGLDDPRGNLALEYLSLARRLRARWIVWENVPGVLSSYSGGEQAEREVQEGPVGGEIDGIEDRDFAMFLSFVRECGYGFAYRVLDAQYVRVDGYARAVPQQRQRVFVVGYLGDWRRAAAVLLEPEGLRRDPPPRREEGPNAACGTLTSAHGGSDIKHAQAGQLIPIAFGGNNTRGPIEVATALNAHGGPMGRMDFESETFVAVPDDAATLTRGAESAGKGGCAGRRREDDHNLVAHTLRADGFDASEDGTGRGTPLVPVAQTLTASWHRSQEQKAGDNVGLMNPIRHALGVRRLTPTECERLQGFPDGYTQVPYRGKPAADGPRYKAIGNSMACNVMRWVGRRIEMMEMMEADE